MVFAATPGLTFATPLSPRQAPGTECAMSQQSWALGAYSATIAIYDKITPEKGSPGSGLFDNLKGECGGLGGTGDQNRVENTQFNPTTGALNSYTMFAILPQNAPTDCVAKAIQKAENQTVVCKVGRPGP